MKITDEVTGVEYSIVDAIVNAIRKIDEQEKRISTLESESISTSNEIYQLYNTIDTLKMSLNSEI
jgi:peptidoglycan hydrolase CwlO-like protein